MKSNVAVRIGNQVWTMRDIHVEYIWSNANSKQRFVQIVNAVANHYPTLLHVLTANASSAIDYDLAKDSILFIEDKGDLNMIPFTLAVNLPFPLLEQAKFVKNENSYTEAKKLLDKLTDKVWEINSNESEITSVLSYLFNL